MRRFIARLINVFKRDLAERDLARELEAHLHVLEDEYARRGLTPDAARLAARRAMGSVALAKDLHRDARSFMWLDDLRQDLRHTGRGLRRAPGFTIVAIITVALGVGANVAIFGLVYQTLIRALPFETPDRLVTVSTYVPQVASRFPLLPVAAPDFVEYQRSNTVFAALSAVQPRDVNLTGHGEPERLHGARVSGNFFRMLGIRPERGRNFAPEEDAPGRDGVVIISHGLWQRRFGSDPDTIGQTIVLDGRSHEIIGIMPPDLLFPVGRQLDPIITFGPRVELWKPMAFTRDELFQHEGSFDFAAIGRLKPGIGIDAAEQHMNVLAARNRERIRKQEAVDVELFARLRPLHEVFVGRHRRGLLLLEAAVGLLLLIACVNLANVFLARTSRRRDEFAVRSALGARRGRLVRQMLTETLVVTSLGGVAGVLVSSWVGPLLLRFGPQTAALREWTFDVPVVIFAATATVLTGVLFGIVPALQSSGTAAAGGLRDAGRTVSDRRTGRLRAALITMEVALCAGLLAVAGLLLHSFINVTRVDAGFASERVLAADLSLPSQQYTSARIVTFYRDLVERVRALPGVAAAGAVSLLPIAHEGVISSVLLDSDREFRIDRPPALRRSVTAGLFAAMETPLRAGRLFEEGESRPSAIISETLAHKLWPGVALGDVVGRGIRHDPKDPVITVVGVVGDVRAEALDRAAPATIYRPVDQEPRRAMTLVVKATDDPRALAASVRTVVSTLDRDLPIAAMRTMQEIVSASVAERRFQMALVSIFSLLALTLAVVGIYGVASYAVGMRTREIGVRMALGAQRSEVIAMVMREGLRPVAIGLCAGVLAGQVGSLAIQSVLFGIGAFDPMVLTGMATLLALTAILACYLPARRAATVEPLAALRAE
jgi:putative ABC transport system permease protein